MKIGNLKFEAYFQFLYLFDVDKSLGTLKVIIRKPLFGRYTWGTQINVVITIGYPKQQPPWLDNNRNMTFIVYFMGFQMASSFVKIG